MIRSRVWVAALLAMALVAAACGGDDPEPAAAPTTAAPATTAAAPAETTTTAAMVEETTTTAAAEVTTTTQLTGIELAGGEGSCAPEPEAAPPRGVAPVDGMTIVRAISGDVSTIDPRRNFEARASEMVANMYDQLTTFHLVPNADGVLVADSTRPQGLLAESWDFNEDCTSVIFTLRQGVKFHHTGNEMTAEDVRWSFLRAAYLDGGGWFDHAVIGLYDFGSESDIETAITVIDDYHIRFDFNKPTPFPLHVLSNAGVTVYDSEVLMAHATDDDPWAHEYLKTNDVGTGPFYLEKLEPGVEIVLKRNDDYYLGPAQAERIILRVIPDAAQQAALLTAGEIDFAEAVPVTAIPDLRDQGVKVTTVGGNNQAVMYMNPTKEPFNDVNFRQAISYAYPYDDVLEGVYFGAASRGGGPIPSTTPSYNPDAPFYSQDLDKARELLAASSYDGRTLDLYIDGTLAFAPELAIVVQASLAQIGVDVNIVRLDSGQFRDNVFAQDGDVRINPMEFFLFYFGSGSWVNEPQYHMELFWEPNAFAMRSNYENPEVTEKLIAAKFLSPADPARTQLYHDVQALMLADAPAVWLAEPHHIVASSQEVQGFIWRPDQINRYYYVTKTA